MIINLCPQHAMNARGDRRALSSGASRPRVCKNALVTYVLVAWTLNQPVGM
jgi:hypothetical protein